MSALARFFLILGGVNAALVVVLGAFGAHGLKARLSSDMMAVGRYLSMPLPLPGRPPPKSDQTGR